MDILLTVSFPPNPTLRPYSFSGIIKESPWTYPKPPLVIVTVAIPELTTPIVAWAPKPTPVSLSRETPVNVPLVYPIPVFAIPNVIVLPAIPINSPDADPWLRVIPSVIPALLYPVDPSPTVILLESGNNWLLPVTVTFPFPSASFGLKNLTRPSGTKSAL